MEDAQWDDDSLAADERRAAEVRKLNRLVLPKPDGPRLITVANQKGGVGKTTSTVNMAAALATYGQKVLVVDLDPQGNASTALGVEHHAGVISSYEMLIGEANAAEAIQITPSNPDLHCIPATIDLAGAEIELVSLERREYRLADALRKGYVAAEGYDYILIDCPPSLGLLTLNAFAAADSVLMPIQCEFYALEGVSQLMKTIELVRSNLNSDLAVEGVLMTMYDSRTRLAVQVVEEVQKAFEGLVYKTMIPRTVRLSEAPSYGQPILYYDKKSKGAEVYQALAKEVIARGK